ncbi:MAG: grasp-with-spasm system SPASM domain peptide maturase [Bacteroidia bacterium]
METPVRQLNKCFLLYASCVPVKGYARSIIADLQREQYLPVPNLLADILIQNRGISTEEIKARYDHAYDTGIDTWFRELEKAEWGFFTEEPECFPPLSMDWDHPSAITQAILDMDKKENYEIDAIIGELDALGCKALQIRVFGNITAQQAGKWAAAAAETGIFSMEMILPASVFRDMQEAEAFVAEYCRLVSLVLYGANEDQPYIAAHPAAREVIYLTSTVLTPESVEKTGPEFFITNIHAFTEAQHHNLGLNRKIAIDTQGLIRHFPGHKRSFGKAGITSLNEIVADAAFQQVWNISADQIETCRDCEFRYLCPDNSEIEAKDGKYVRLTTCGYDPYSGTWQ